MDARIEHQTAMRAAHQLRGKIASAEKQALYGSPESAAIANATLPSLYRRLDDAEATIARITPLLPPSARRFERPSSNIVWNFRTDYPSPAELDALELPAFLQRAAA